MMDEQGTRSAALLEDIDRKLGVLAEAIAVQDARSKKAESKLDGIEARFGELTFEMHELKKTVSDVAAKVDKLEGKVDKLEGKVDKLDAFATDAAPRLERLEAFAIDAAPRLERLEAFAIDAAPRLVRIEKHLALPALPPRRARAKLTPSKHHRRKPMKRN